MPINLQELENAADRFTDYTKAIEKIADEPDKVLIEEAEVAERHRKIFTPAAERLLKTRSSSLFPPTTVENVLLVTPDPADRTDAPQIEVAVIPLTVSTSGLIPEIIQRDNDLRPMRYLHIGLMAARSVGHIRISDGFNSSEGDATGFMIAPQLLMTNHHVLKTKDIAAAASVIFNDEEGIDGDPLETKAFRLRPDILFVNDEILDYAIVAVTPRNSSGALLSDFGYLRLFKETGKLDPTRREAANIIQHPGGGPKKIALRDNYILKVLPESVDPNKNENSLFYGTDTLKGSSGAPVCSDQWYVVALHRGGVPKTQEINGKRVVMRWSGQPATTHDSTDMIEYVTNEGTRISRIFNSLEQKAAMDKKSQAALILAQITAAAGSPHFGPISQRTIPLLLPIDAGDGGQEEIIRRRRSKFENVNGYIPTFLGSNYKIKLPEMTSEVKRELAKLKDSEDTELKYANYSLTMNRERRTAFFAAGNINGSLLWKAQGQGALPSRPPWSYDPRMDETFQPDDVIFSNSMQRGHLFKREDAVWGSDREAMKLADEHSFTITNATPMIGNFNNVEWGDLEDIVSRDAQTGNKISYFAGPIFRSTDRFFNELRLDVPVEKRRTGMRVPESFWKIVAWVENSKLKAAGFIRNQSDEIETHGPITEEIDFKTYKKVPINEIEQSTGLRFPDLNGVDTFGE